MFASGYAHAKIFGEVEVARATSEVAIAIYVRAGPLVHFGPPVLTGSTALPKLSRESRIAWNWAFHFSLGEAF